MKRVRIPRTSAKIISTSGVNMTFYLPKSQNVTVRRKNIYDYLKRSCMKRHIVVYKRKKYIKVATAIGSQFYRIAVAGCLLISCVSMIFLNIH